MSQYVGVQKPKYRRASSSFAPPNYRASLLDVGGASVVQNVPILVECFEGAEETLHDSFSAHPLSFVPVNLGSSNFAGSSNLSSLPGSGPGTES